MLLAIDPGPKTCGVVSLSGLERPPVLVWHRKAWPVKTLLNRIYSPGGITNVAIEAVTSYGMPVGADVFETCYVIGRIIEACERRFIDYKLIPRKEVCLHLCHSARAQDANVRRAILDLYPATGGGATPQKGTKKQPGPLHGVSSHAWSALAVGLTAIGT
jgi:hypothetical protein